MKHYNLVVVGGTFDRLHRGHKSFLMSALSFSNELVLGLTTDNYVRNIKKVSTTSPYESRKKELQDFFSGISDAKVTIIPLGKNEIHASWQKKVDAIAVTANTLIGAEELNSIRLKNGYKVLPIIVFPLQKGEDGDVISSSRIRAGLIDRDGIRYLNEEMQSYAYILPEKLRHVLQKPLGKITKTDEELKNISAPILITVGDITTQKFLNFKRKPNISIVDFVVERKTVFTSLSDLGFSSTEPVYTVNNPPAHIVSELFVVLDHLLRRGLDKNISIIRVIGEEDLTVIPVILLAPLGAVICYGQPKEGTVAVAVTEELKEAMKDLLSQFEIVKT